MQVHNDINVRIDISGVTAAATLLLRMSEDALLNFPLKDFSNSYCWISTIVASDEDFRGIALVGHALRLQGMDLNVTCNDCSSPQFGELIADLYNPRDADEATETVLQTLSQVLNGEAIQDYLDQIVMESASKCPHSSSYDPNAVLTATEYLKNQGEPFSLTDFTSRSERSSYFNIASAIFGASLLCFFAVGKAIVWRRNMKWLESLSSEGMLLLRRQKAKERQQEEIINMYSTSLLQSRHIPRHVRLAVPAVIIVNIALYLGGHIGVISTVDVEVHLAGEDFAVRDFLVFSFFESTATTYKNGGMEMSIMLWVFTFFWPYAKLLSSLFLWVVPPRMLSVNTRGKLLLWIDTLTKLSIIDIFTLILFLAVLLVYIGGPDEALSADGALYSMKAIVIPRAGLYCMVIAQRISRVSSRFFLEYHDQDVAAARTVCASDTKKENGNIADPWLEYNDRDTGKDRSKHSPHDLSKVEEQGQRVTFDNSICAGRLKEEADVKDETPAPENREEDSFAESNGQSISSLKDENPQSCMLRLRLLGGQLGVAFGSLAVVVLAIIGCIYAPSVSVEISDLWGLVLEAETTFEEAATEYGVFFVVSSVLLKSRFKLDATWDYVALGFLLTVAFVSVGMVFFVSCYSFLKRLAKEGWSATRPNHASSIMELPSYLSLHAYQHIEIYVVSVVIGCGQLGSVSIYAIHLYCSILDAVYKVLTYIGLATSSTAQCFEAQMTISDNLLIFFGALLILLGNFCVQSAKQYQKNINEACDLLRHEDHDIDHLSSLWNSPSKKGFWRSSRQLMPNNTATFSEDDSGGSSSQNSYRTAKSSAPFTFLTKNPSAGDVSPVSSIASFSPVGDEVFSSNEQKDPSYGSPVSDRHRVIASVDQYSTPQ